MALGDQEVRPPLVARGDGTPFSLRALAIVRKPWRRAYRPKMSRMTSASAGSTSRST